MESLLENKALAYSLLFSSTSILALASGLAPELTEKFELVVLPTEVRISFFNSFSTPSFLVFSIETPFCSSWLPTCLVV